MRWAYLFLALSFGIDGLKMVVESLASQKLHPIETKEEKLTVLIAAHNSSGVIAGTIRSIRATLPKSHILVVNDASEDDTQIIAEKEGAEVYSLPKNSGKVGAIHSVISKVRTPYVLLLDDDTELVNTKIPTNLLKRHDAVAFNVLPFGDGLLSHFQRHEYRKSSEISKKFHSHTATVPCISGACGLFRRSALLKQLRLHSGEFSGEDLQRTLLIHRYNKKNGVAYVGETVYTHAPQKFGELYIQRVHGWWPGLWNNLKHFFYLGFSRKVPWRLRYDAIYSILLVLTDPLRILALPALVSSPFRLILFYFFYVLIEAFPYFRMGRKESILVLFLAPVYGMFGLFARTVGFFVWLYRRFTSLGKMKSVPDAYLHAPLPQKIFAFMFGSVFCLSLISLGVFENYSQAGIEITQGSIRIQAPQEETPVLRENYVRRKPALREKIYFVNVEKGDGGIVIARKAISEYRNDFGGYNDYLARLHAEERLGKFIKSSNPRIKAGQSLSISELTIKNHLESDSLLQENSGSRVN